MFSYEPIQEQTIRGLLVFGGLMAVFAGMTLMMFQLSALLF